MVKRYAVGVGIGFAASAISLVILAFFAARMDDPRAVVQAFGLIVFFVGVCVAALVGGRLLSDLPALGALGSGGIYTAVIFVLSLAFRGADTRPVWQSLIVYGIGVALSGVIGLLLAGGSTGSRRTRKNLRKKMGRR